MHCVDISLLRIGELPVDGRQGYRVGGIGGQGYGSFAGDVAGADDSDVLVVKIEVVDVVLDVVVVGVIVVVVLLDEVVVVNSTTLATTSMLSMPAYVLGTVSPVLRIRRCMGSKLLTAMVCWVQSDADIVNSATSIEFTISDITGDTNAETIRYEWSGIPGDPLQRAFNGSLLTTVIANVHMFTLTYHTRIVTDNAGQESYFNTGVTATVQIGTDSASQIRTTVRTFNEPEISHP